MAKKRKGRIPEFKSEEEEAEFWATHSPEDFADELEPVDIEFTLSKKLRTKHAARRCKKQLTIRLEQRQIDAARAIAAHKGIGYQTLLRMWIVEGIRNELRKAS